MPYERFDGDLEEAAFTAKAASADISKGVMTINATCPNRKGITWKGFVIRYAHKVEEDKEAYFIEPASVLPGKRAYGMTLRLQLEGFPFRYTHWWVLCVFEKDGKLFGARIQMPKKAKGKKGLAKFLLSKQNFRTADGNIVFFYSQKGNNLGIRYRAYSPYDSQLTRVKEVAARGIYRLRKDAYDERNIYLVFEKRCQHAQDNGYYFFRYCMENGMEEYLDREIYYVLEKGSVDRRKLAAFEKNVVDFASIRHMVYLQAANLLISPDSRAHAYIWQNQQSLIAGKARKIPHVFLGHGVLALKRLNDSFTAKSMGSVLCTVVSEKERRIFTEELGFKNTQAAITGYARFDALKDCSAEHNEILIMPTHRNWLFGVEREVFTASDYYRRYMDLINSPHLIEQLEKHDLTVMFYLHPSIGEHIDAFSSTSDRVKIVPYGQYALDDLMMRCKLLVTDYSSVLWDVLYMGKPVILYQYDMQAYMDTWGSYIDLETESPGERVTDFEGLLAAIDEAIEGGFALSDELAAKRDEYYAFTDTDNCKRICEVLKARRF